MKLNAVHFASYLARGMPQGNICQFPYERTRLIMRLGNLMKHKFWASFGLLTVATAMVLLYVQFSQAVRKLPELATEEYFANKRDVDLLGLGIYLCFSIILVILVKAFRQRTQVVESQKQTTHLGEGKNWVKRMNTLVRSFGLVLLALTVTGCSKLKSIYLINFMDIEIIVQTQNSDGRSDVVEKKSGALLTCDMYVGGDLNLLVTSKGLTKEVVVDYETMKKNQLSDSLVIVELR